MCFKKLIVRIKEKFSEFPNLLCKKINVFLFDISANVLGLTQAGLTKRKRGSSHHFKNERMSRPKKSLHFLY